MKNIVSTLFLCLVFLSFPIFAFSQEKIDINTAPIEDLVKIIHIGEVRAQELISLRPFSSLDELVRINGIGEKRLEDIKKQGLAYVTPITESEPEIQPELQQEPLAATTTGPIVSPGESTPTTTGAAIPQKKETERVAEIAYPSGIVFNEILPSPEGPDAQGEWIEIFNQNDFEVDLSGWQIKDSIGRTTVFTFPEGKKIPGKGFLVLGRPETKIILNNDGDTLKLLNPNEEEVDKVTFPKAPRRESYNLIAGEWIWSDILSPGSENHPPQPEPKPITEIKNQKTEETKILPQKISLASIGQASEARQIPILAGRNIVLAISIVFSLVSGIIAWIIKRKLLL